MKDRPSSGMRRTVVALATVALAGLLVAAVLPGSSSGTADAQSMIAAVSDPAALVHPIDGTGTGSVSPGTVGIPRRGHTLRDDAVEPGHHARTASSPVAGTPTRTATSAASASPT